MNVEINIYGPYDEIDEVVDEVVEEVADPDEEVKDAAIDPNESTHFCHECGRGEL